MFAVTGQVMTLANSIIGVGILAMPYCFQKCGVLLSIVLLLASNFLTRISCHYLIKSSLLTRRRNFEFLAFHAFGFPGKLMVELCVIGYLMGTCVAYYVVVGDIGPQIIAKLFDLNNNDTLRTCVMIVVTIICVVPLGLLKNVDSLATVCTASIGFYFCMVLKVMAESEAHLALGDWYDKVDYWKPKGILQCLPIFSMALSCQMQLFEIYETMPTASLEKINATVRSATNICTIVYIFVGFFGYIAFCSQEFSGNILLNFSESLTSDIIKIGFVLSVAFSFPLVIFPCRASLYSLVYRRNYSDAASYIPEPRFKSMTFVIVFITLLVGLFIPSIELVIGLIGSTIGVVICLMFPSSLFFRVSKKDSNERMFAQIVLFFGFSLMILGTYANLQAINEKKSGTHSFKAIDNLEPIIIKPTISSPVIEQILKEIDVVKVEKLPVEIELLKSKLPEQPEVKDPVKLEEPKKEKLVIKLADPEPGKKDEIDKNAIKKEEEIVKEEIEIGKADAIEIVEEKKEEIVKEIKKLEETKKQLQQEVIEMQEKLEEIPIEQIEKKVPSAPISSNPVIQLLTGERLDEVAKNVPDPSLSADEKIENIKLEVPISYKIGEMLTETKNKTVNVSLPPIPSSLNNSIRQESNSAHQKVENIPLLPEKPPPNNDDDKTLSESLHRDLLELHPHKDEIIITTKAPPNSAQISNHQPPREKRDAEEQKDKNCDGKMENTVDGNNLGVESRNSIINENFDSLLKIDFEAEIKSVGRDLKSVNESEG